MLTLLLNIAMIAFNAVLYITNVILGNTMLAIVNAIAIGLGFIGIVISIYVIRIEHRSNSQ